MLIFKEAELEKATKKLEQVEHKMNRLQNKIKTESKKQSLSNLLTDWQRYPQ